MRNGLNLIPQLLCPDETHTRVFQLSNIVHHDREKKEIHTHIGLPTRQNVRKQMGKGTINLPAKHDRDRVNRRDSIAGSCEMTVLDVILKYTFDIL